MNTLVEMGAQQQELASFRRHARRLLKLTAPYCNRKALSVSDAFGFMLLSLMNKQWVHLEALVHLKDRWDTLLIARSMLETWALLHWASLEKESRGLDWQAFSCVLAWRDARERKARGIPVDQDAWAATSAYLNKYGRRFYSAAAAKAEERGSPLPDPYVTKWPPETVKSLFQSAKEIELYDDVYSPMAFWHHSNSGGISLAAHNRPGRTEFVMYSAYSATLALQAGITCLSRMLNIYGEHFNFRHARNIMAWRRRYDALLHESQPYNECT